MSKTGQLLLEIRSGEIPAKMQEPARKQLREKLKELFSEQDLGFESIETFVSPRRLCALVEGLMAVQPQKMQERRGPRVGAPQQALDGFLKSVGVSLDQLEERQTDKGMFYFHQEVGKEQETTLLLPGLIEKLLETFKWPKSMTWSTSEKKWIRPITGGLCLFAGKPVPFSLNFSSPQEQDPVIIYFNDMTVGHPRLSPSPFKVKGFDDYVRKLKQAFVLVDQKERAKVIQEQVDVIEKEHEVFLIEDVGLMNEVVGLTEWPFVLLGDIDKEFLNLPPEVLKTTMRVHQRYFSLRNEAGKFMPHFLVVADHQPRDGGERIKNGNESVLCARLSDAQFFVSKDQQKPLAEHALKLKGTLFHQSLGTLYDKQLRVEMLLSKIFPKGKSLDQALTASKIFKADLNTELVFEFPELQGITGAHYSKVQGHSCEVFEALYHQYDSFEVIGKMNHAALYLAFADRLDTLVGFFCVGLKPTGSKDPFALRRATLNLIRLLEHLELGLKLSELFKIAFDLHATAKHATLNEQECLETLHNFVKDRISTLWQDQGYSLAHILSVLGDMQKPLPVLKGLLKSLESYIQHEPKLFEDLLQAYKRSRNILRGAALKDVPTIKSKLFEKEAEKKLFEALEAAGNKISDAMKAGAYTQAFSHLSSLHDPVSLFFEDVLVNAEDQPTRLNRLALLQELTKCMESVVDFSQMA